MLRSLGLECSQPPRPAPCARCRGLGEPEMNASKPGTTIERESTAAGVRVAFDSRPARNQRGIGRYTRCLLRALRDAGRGQIAESHVPRRCEVFHSPWLEGALLRSPVPMVVTIH